MPRVLFCAGFCLASATMAVAPAQADKPPTVEVSAGGETGGHSWSAYANTTVALSGLIAGVPKSIREDGWRLRAGAGYWQAKWRGDGVAGFATRARLQGGSADFLLGYHRTFGPLTLKFFAGVEYANGLAEFHEGVRWSGFDNLGAKLTAESWYNLTSDVFLQFDASWSSRNEGASGRARLGYRTSPVFALGPELAHWSQKIDPHDPCVCDKRVESTRYGAFMRYEWPGGEVSLSGGLADDGHDSNFYTSLNALLRF